MSQIKTYYESLIAKDYEESLALLRTAAVFSVSPNQVKRALKRAPKPRVRKPQPRR
jgi:hypothetical protein